MLCYEIISEFEKQTKLLEQVVNQLEKLNAHVSWRANRRNVDGGSLLKADKLGVDMEKRLLSVEEAAEYLGIATSTIYNRSRRNSENPFPVKPKRVGRRVKFDREELDAYVDSL